MGVDPGKVTGVAMIHYSSSSDIFDTFYAFELPAMKAAKEIDCLIADNYESGHLECEAYTVNSNTVKHARQYDALEMIGVCRFLTMSNGWDFHLQSPGSRKIVTVEALDRLGWHKPSKDKHMEDAAKHMTVACMRMGILKAEAIR